MTHNDFRAAVEVEVTRWRFLELVRRSFEQTGPPPGAGTESPEVSTRLASSGDLLAPRDTAPALDGRGGSETGDL